ncbi:16S rRNA (adenine(1518)-N(6)/adenine(1519)-N(6))-dimethyltransferase RsmA [Oceanospirillum sediminis]|uniref:Ribosomal RNA small subunit methyltransferase A n=1 Tax=Oceanospirillum sediminis TaxID=2760088 RepID=A0A839IVL7_9GAMM|nr:16S rRNA (adenine(1518)-N(6)/adenine(1519)-N(6))-dimethyltransferase RsmA [Oceanospirillum sediminis]MBB1488447.1 16S rRNA (adenine(1518)-N(6)/adenine(1519)-N(6))-dimethyltransferase RsmA [Oceanospirillum sediminis]
MAKKPQQHRARKRFGQNFLQDEGIIRRIVRSISPREKQHLVEIGPGMGALTEIILESADRLDVIELDRDLIPGLKVKFFNHPGFNIHQADALKFNFAELMDDDQPLRVVGNLPYNISTPLIFHLLDHKGVIQDMHFMLQKEVVERLAAAPGTNDWGRLGIMTQYLCDVEALFLVPPEAFDPMPKVDSAIVRLTPHKELPHPAKSVECLDLLVRTAFTQRRKTLRNNLKTLLTADEIESLNIDPGCRPETLSLQKVVELSDLLADKRNRHD